MDIYTCCDCCRFSLRCVRLLAILPMRVIGIEYNTQLKHIHSRMHAHADARELRIAFGVVLLLCCSIVRRSEL